MKKIVTEKIIFTDEDIELLKIEKLRKIPKSKCDSSHCGLGMVCCGCPYESARLEAWKPYEERGIDEIARNLLYLDNLKSQRIGIEKKISEVEIRLPEEILEKYESQN